MEKKKCEIHEELSVEYFSDAYRAASPYCVSKSVSQIFGLNLCLHPRNKFSVSEIMINLNTHFWCPAFKTLILLKEYLENRIMSCLSSMYVSDLCCLDL